MTNRKLLCALAALAVLNFFAFDRSSASTAPAAPAAPDEPKLADLAWMAGHWASEQDGARVEEAWLAPAGGFLLGMNRTAPKSGRGSFEYLRIEQRAEEIVYVASPSGRGATEFPLHDFGEYFALFENPEHDFPQRIRYELTADGSLHARVSGDVEGRERAMEWTWKPVR